MIAAIAIVGRNREIGFQNKLLWDIPDDLKHFKRITDGHIVVMGSKTYESLKGNLPNRINIVIAMEKNYDAPGCVVANSINDALDLAKDLAHQEKKDVFIIGGGSIYAQMLEYCDKLYLTLVDDAPQADTMFPDYSEFKNTISNEPHEYNGLKYTFLELTR